ncbi:MAG: hypothetical protein KGH90_10765 [Xanthomonadaceae bacterium]|nr:hypothetical protein [Xanthomonadaceae bacterium]
MTDESLPFFRILAGSRPFENYLSRTFQACFTQSPAFANSALSLLWDKCRLKGDPPDATAWVCDYQPATPNGGKIRPDLRLRPSADNVDGAQHKPIFIESKVGARLGEKQLKNYIDSGTEILVAVTKNWPEVPRTRLETLKVNHLRWQDVSRALSSTSGHRGKDKFLCDAFLEFLEYSNMAYREDITLRQLEDVRRLLSKISYPGRGFIVPGVSFASANSCLSLLQDARRIAYETMPTKPTEVANWGPGYFHVPSGDDPASIDLHALGFEMYPKGKGQYSKIHLLCALYFSAKKKK